MSTKLLSGVVESISRTGIVVLQDGKAVNIIGDKAAELAKQLKLGDNVEFDKAENPDTLKIAKPPKEAKPKTKTTRPTGSSPNAAARTKIW